MEMKTYVGESEFMMSMDFPDMKLLMLQMSVNIISDIETNNILHNKTRKYIDYVSDHANINMFQSQINILYNMVKMLINHPYPYKNWLEDSEKNLIVKALEEYQKYKTNICLELQKEHGKHWGTATGFYQKDWTDLNEQFLSK